MFPGADSRQKWLRQRVEARNLSEETLGRANCYPSVAPMARLPQAALTVALLLSVSSARATTLLCWDTLELSRRSQAVVQGHVLRVTTRFSADGMRIL